jgi:hypothetical protein
LRIKAEFSRYTLDMCIRGYFYPRRKLRNGGGRDEGKWAHRSKCEKATPLWDCGKPCTQARMVLRVNGNVISFLCRRPGVSERKFSIRVACANRTLSPYKIDIEC